MLRLKLRLLSKNIHNLNWATTKTGVRSGALAADYCLRSLAHNPTTATLQIRHHSSLFGRNKYAYQRHAVMSTKVRSVSVQELTKNLQLVTDGPRDVRRDPKTLKLQNPSERPLVIMLAWLLAKKKPLLKYAEIYVEQGFDVLTITVSPWQLLWPVKGSHVVTADVVSFLENNHQFSPILIHGFSVGAYVWAECMVHISRDMQRYSGILDRICGQVWDSAADVTEIPIGVPKAVFPNNPTLQRTLSNYMQYHMRTFHDVATQHYFRASQMFHNNIVRTPALMLVSADDPVGSVSSNDAVRQDWLRLNISCTWKCWDHSEHVCHYIRHQDEYREILFNHLDSLGLVPRSERLRAKL